MRAAKTKLIFVICLAFLIATSLPGCTKGGDPSAQKAYKSETIVWWRTWDNEDAMSGLISAYRQLHPNVNIEYRKFRYEEYEKELLEAMAEDRGPDIFSVHNTWMERYKSKILPLPPRTVVPVKYTTGSLKKEEVVNFITANSVTPAQVRKKFLDVVALDVLMSDENAEGQPEKAWGLPLSLDTLVLYYNKDLMNNAGIVEPPANWSEFQEGVKKMTKIEKDSGNILVSGAAIGTADNVVRNFDILSLLMMQNLTPMFDDYGNVIFDKRPKNLDEAAVSPGLGALEYYTQFASPLHEAYCWNDKMPDSLEAFISGRAAFFFGYSYHRELIRARAPKLNFAIAPVPQVGENQKVNYANYWVETVSNKTKIKDYAWNFLQFITDEKNVENYLDKNKKPTALRSTALINKQLADEEIAVFADQLLTAKSWYHGYNSTGAEEAFAEMVNSVLSGNLEPIKALKQAVLKVQYSLTKKL